MRNVFVDERSALEIAERVARIHRDLGNPTGKVELAEVRELLKLDLHYYSAQDPGLLDEVVHKLTVGTRQVIKRPGLLLDAIKKFSLKALFLPDRKRILIEASLPDLKKRWSEGHEIIHSAIPWHADYMLGDDKRTLSPDCHDQIEAEANYGAGRLLFPPTSFLALARSAPPRMTHIRSIAKHFGNTITSTLWRFVENSDDIMFALVGEHPQHPKEDEPNIVYFIRSRAFLQQFTLVSESELFDCMRSYCNRKKSGPIGEGEVILTDASGGAHVFFMESFSNSHNALTLGVYRRAHAVAVASF